MSAVLAYSSANFAMIATDTLIVDTRGGQRREIEGEKLHNWGGGFAAGAGIVLPIRIAVDDLRQFVPTTDIDVRASLKMAWQAACSQAPRDRKLDVVRTSIMVSFGSPARVIVYAPAQFQAPVIRPFGEVDALAPLDADTDQFQLARSAVQRVDSHPEMIRQAARFLCEVNKFSRDVSRTLDAGINFGAERARYRGLCEAILSGDDLAEFRVC